MTPSLGLINLLEWLTELRETFYLLGYQFIINGYNSRRARWNRCFGQGVGKGHGASTPSLNAPLRKSTQARQPKKLFKPSLLGFL